MMNPTRTYEPKAEHLMHCAKCGTVCLPCPGPDSKLCSWCYWLMSHDNGKESHDSD